MARSVSIRQPLPLRSDVPLRPETRQYFEEAQRIVDLTWEALGTISRLHQDHQDRLRLPLRRLRSCYRNGRLFGDNFRSAVHFVAQELTEAPSMMPDTSAREELIGLLRELVRANWNFRRQTLDELTWRKLHEQVADLNRRGPIPLMWCYMS